MKSFDFHRPTSLAAAAELLATLDSPKLLAGGQSLLPALRLRLAAPSDLIDLSGVEDLRGLAADAHAVRVGAMTSHAAVAASTTIQQAIPALARLAGGIADRQVRNRGTLGGSLANNDPAACYPAAVLALGATVRTQSRRIAADEFFTGMFTTVLEPGEIVVEVSFPVPLRAAYRKFPQPASRFAIAGVFVAQFRDAVRVAVTGAGLDGVFRVPAMEDALQTEFVPQSLAGVNVDTDGLATDLHAGSDYRAHLVNVLARSCVSECLGEIVR